MKIPGATDIRNWDQYTIEHEPVASIDLMERAALACVKWINENNYANKSFHIFCGKGNNGGDGLAIARLLAEKGTQVTVHILEFGHLGTEDFQKNLARLHQYPDAEIRFIQTPENFPAIEQDDVIVDALIGSGLNRKLDSVTAGLVNQLNEFNNRRIAIDIPSGMFADHSSKGNIVIKADHTLSFQCYKPAFMMQENGEFLGKVHVLDIGLHPGFYDSLQTGYELIDEELITSIYKPRNAFSHKGDHGHALLFAGGYGKTGAGILAARACLRSGVGLLTCHIPSSSYQVMQTAVPESMVSTDFNSSFITRFEGELAGYGAIGIGPGMGSASETRQFLKWIIENYQRPMVIDADGLNILGMEKDLLKNLKEGSILTPHPKEFDRLFGETGNDFERIELAKNKAVAHGIIIVLKGHHTFIALPGGRSYFNSTGNAGMATGGSGDVLTGILTALLAQKYSPENASILGVYLHGMAGDLAMKELSMEAMVAGDIVDNLPMAFKYLVGLKT